MLYALNLHKVMCQLYLSNTRKKIQVRMTWAMWYLVICIKVSELLQQSRGAPGCTGPCFYPGGN